MENKMTPKEFAAKMREIVKDPSMDEEGAHYCMDELLCQVLRELGFAEGVEVFEEADKWYA